MKMYAAAVVILCLSTGFSLGEEKEGGNSTHVTVLAPTGSGLSSQLTSEIKKAQELKLTPFIQVTAEWCGPCRRLHAGMSDPLMVDAFQGTYVIKLDAEKWNETLKGTDYYPRGIPAFIAIDDKGQAVGKINGGAWGEDIPENMAPPLKKFFSKYKWAY